VFECLLALLLVVAVTAMEKPRGLLVEVLAQARSSGGFLYAKR
jgi:hypothetical protein